MMTPEKYAAATAELRTEQSHLIAARLRTVRRAAAKAMSPEGIKARAEVIAADLIKDGATDMMIAAGVLAEELLAVPGAREAGERNREALSAALYEPAKPGPRKPLEHGTEKAYVNGGCRCLPCVEGSAIARRARKANAEAAKAHSKALGLVKADDFALAN